MSWIVGTLILAVAAFVFWLVAHTLNRRIAAAQAASASVDPDLIVGRKVAKGAFIAVIAVICLETLLCSFAQVSTKNVGVETAFGKTAGFLSNGAHLIPPWDNVTEMDAAIQTDSYTDATADAGPCMSVRIGNQQTACVSVSIRWRINPALADSLFQNYRTFEHVRDSLVTRELTSAVNNQFRAYNPLNSIAATNTTGKTNPSLATYADLITAQMKQEIGPDGIEVLNTIIPLIQFDPATQARINQLQQQFAQTLIAEQARQTNIAQAQANKALAASVNTSPNVLVAECMGTFAEMVKLGQTLPPGFSCWPGSGSKLGILATVAPVK